MNISVEKQPKCTAHLNVEIPSETVALKRNEILKSFLTQARVPGFRPGKVPRAVVLKRHGKAIDEELHNDLVKDACSEAIQKEDLRVLDFGDPVIAEQDDGSVVVTATLLLAPEFTLPEYKSVKVTVPGEEVPEEDLDAELETFRERFARYEPVTERTSVTGDFVQINYDATIDGTSLVEFAGEAAAPIANGRELFLKLDEESFLPGFCSHLIDLKPEQEIDFKITLPEDFPIEKLRSQEIDMHLELLQLLEQQLPDDEELVNLTHTKDIAELRSQMEANLLQRRHRAIENLKVDQIVEHLCQAVDFELPESLLTEESQSQLDQLTREFINSGATIEQLMERREEISSIAATRANTNLRSNFILMEIAKAEDIRVNDQELVQHLARIAEQQKTTLKKLVTQLRREERLDGIRNSVLVGKVLDFLIKEAEVEISEEATLDT